MDLKVTSMHAQGDEEKEIFVIKAQKDCNLKGYMIFDNAFKDYFYWG